MLASTDLLEPTISDGGLEKADASAHASVNIGVMLLRPGARALCEEWIATLMAHPRRWDQEVFDRLLKHDMRALRRRDRLFSAYRGELLAGVLPVLRFCGGHVYFVQRLPQRLNRTCAVVHATFLTGTPEKRSVLREEGLYLDAPTYYAPRGGGVVTYEPELPEELVRRAARMTRDGKLASMQPHFDLVNHQLSELRTAFITAALLGGAPVVLPRFQCAAAHWWEPHRGLINMHGVAAPYPCPAAQILDFQQ